MTFISKYSGVLFAAAALAVTTLKADDKPATTNSVSTNVPKLEDLLPDPVVVKGKGFEIKRSRLDEAVSSIRANYTAAGRELTPADLPLIEKFAYERLLQIKLFNLKATDEDRAKGKIEADKNMDAIVKHAPSEEKLAIQLRSVGLTIEGLRVRLAEEATAQQVLRDKVTVTDAQIKKFYDDNPEKFEEPEMVRISHILIATLDGKTGAPLPADDLKAKKKIVDDLLKRAKAGEDFAKLAREYSDDPGSKDKGGEITMARGGRVPKEFEAAAFTLQTNQISDVVTSQIGYHIIKLSEKTPARKLELDKVTPDIKNYLEGKEIDKIAPENLALLKKEANVEILDDQLKSMIEAADAAEAASKKAHPMSAPN